PRRHSGSGAAAPRAPAPRGRASRTRPWGAPPPQHSAPSPGPSAATADEPGAPPATSPAEQRRHIRRHQPDHGQQHRCQPPPPVRDPLLLTSGDPLLGRVDLGFQLGDLIGDLLVLDLVHLDAHGPVQPLRDLPAQVGLPRLDTGQGAGDLPRRHVIGHARSCSGGGSSGLSTTGPGSATNTPASTTTSFPAGGTHPGADGSATSPTLCPSPLTPETARRPPGPAPAPPPARHPAADPGSQSGAEPPSSAPHRPTPTPGTPAPGTTGPPAPRPRPPPAPPPPAGSEHPLEPPPGRPP